MRSRAPSALRHGAVPDVAARVLRERFGPDWRDVATSEQVDEAVDEVIRADAFYLPLRGVFFEGCCRALERTPGARLIDVVDGVAAEMFGSKYSKVALILCKLWLDDYEAAMTGARCSQPVLMLTTELHRYKLGQLAAEVLTA